MTNNRKAKLWLKELRREIHDIAELDRYRIDGQLHYHIYFRDGTEILVRHVRQVRRLVSQKRELKEEDNVK